MEVDGTGLYLMWAGRACESEEDCKLGRFGPGRSRLRMGRGRASSLCFPFHAHAAPRFPPTTQIYAHEKGQAWNSRRHKCAGGVLAVSRKAKYSRQNSPCLAS